MIQIYNLISQNDVVRILPHDNDAMIINVKSNDWEIKQVLIYLRSLVDVLYSDAFERLKLDSNELQTFRDYLVGFLDKQVYLKGYISLMVVFGLKENSKIIKVGYLAVEALSSHNIIIWRISFNL